MRSFKASKMVLMMLFTASLIACGKGSDAQAPLGSKTIWSHWTGDLDLDLKSGQFNHTFYMTFHFDPDSNCHSDVYATGDESSGTFQISGSFYVLGGTGDPGCAALDGNYTYTRTAPGIRICSGGTCYDLQ